jgi:malate dehydrogenase
VISSSALCEGEYGVTGYFIGVPVVIGAGGMEKVLQASLNESERQALAETAKAVIKSVHNCGV